MSEVIYARVPADLKEAVEAYAQQRGTTLTVAFTDLLAHGLEAVSNAASVAQLQQRVRELSTNLRRAELLAEVLQQRDQSWQARDQQWSAAYRALAERTQQQVGTCPNCKAAVSGYDLLVTGRCQACGHNLTSLLDPERKQGGSLDRTEFAVLMGALGMLVGTALQSMQKHLDKGGAGQ